MNDRRWIAYKCKLLELERNRVAQIDLFEKKNIKKHTTTTLSSVSVYVVLRTDFYEKKTKFLCIAIKLFKERNANVVSFAKLVFFGCVLVQKRESSTLTS